MRGLVILGGLMLLAACEQPAPAPTPTATSTYVPPSEGGPCGDGSNPKSPEQCK